MIIYGITAFNNEEIEFENDDSVWCDFSIEYVVEGNSHYYSLNIETMLAFERPGGCRMWIIECVSRLANWMAKHDHDTSKELSMYEVFTEGVNVNTHFKSIEDIFAYLKLMVFGFHGDGMEEGRNLNNEELS